MLQSPALKHYADENEQAADRLDSGNWDRERKLMRESQNARRTQQ